MLNCAAVVGFVLRCWADEFWLTGAAAWDIKVSEELLVS